MKKKQKKIKNIFLGCQRNVFDIRGMLLWQEECFCCQRNVLLWGNVPYVRGMSVVRKMFLLSEKSVCCQTILSVQSFVTGINLH